jgi:hypothetical protein
MLVNAQFIFTIQMRLTEQCSDTNDEDGRNADAYAAVILVVCLAGRHVGFDELKRKALRPAVFAYPYDN